MFWSEKKKTVIIFCVAMAIIAYGLYISFEGRSKNNPKEFNSYDYKYIAQIYEEVERSGENGTFLVFKDGTLMMMTGSMEKNVVSYRLPPDQSAKIHVRKFEDKDFWMIVKVVKRDDLEWMEIAQSYLGVLR